MPYLGQLSQRVKDIVQGYCEEKGYAFVGRVKTAESLAEKVESGRFSDWEKLDDCYACAVVIPTLSEEEGVLEFLRERFDEVELRKRGTTLKDPNVFRFDSTRFIGRLKPSASSSVANAGAGLFGLSFEVQIRTAFEHAWSVTTHALVYKGDRVDWRWLRLTAQLKASVEQLDSLVLGFEQVATAISEQSWPEVGAKREIEEFFRTRVASGVIPGEVVPNSWGRFCDNFLALLLGSTAERVRDPQRLVKRALRVVDAQIQSIKGASFPRSISLIQFVLGALAEGEFLDKPFVKYVPLVTPELLSLFPKAECFGAGFNWEIGG
jgi:ppGpp synthetase/RelA/SpoT-type nucleotidyltranferase